jgi:hypothetical protein
MSWYLGSGASAQRRWAGRRSSVSVRRVTHGSEGLQGLAGTPPIFLSSACAPVTRQRGDTMLGR